MKTILSWRRFHYLTRISILLVTVVFLITVVLIAGMVSWLSAPSCDLTIASTAGGSVIIPGEGTFTCSPRTKVCLMAEAEEGYRFAGWSGDVVTIANAEAAETTVTVIGHCSITATFASEKIWDWYGLAAVSNNLSGNHTLMNDLDSTTPGYEELASPIANQGKGWEPIGTFIPECGYGSFLGTFDGQGYEIRDLYINRPDEYGAGLFANVAPNGVIENIGVTDATVTGLVWVDELVGASSSAAGNSYSSAASLAGAGVGGLVGWNRGIVSNCYFTGSVTSDLSVGGLVGLNTGFVSNSYFTGNVTGHRHVGGLVGWNRGIVSNSYYNYDEVLINHESIITIGALFNKDFEQWLVKGKFLDVDERLSQEDGYYLISNVSDFKKLLAFGQDDSLKFRLINDLDLETEANFYIPYLAGEFDGSGHKIWNLSVDSGFNLQLGLFGQLASSGTVSEVGVENVNINIDINITGSSSVGGLVGRSMGTVNNSYATGSVNGYSNVGGLVGWSTGTVNNSYAAGSVNGYVSVGGLVGQNEDTVSDSYSTSSVTGNRTVGGLVGGNNGIVSNSYSTGTVIGTDYVGGLAGLNTEPSTVSNCYATGSVTGNRTVGGLVGCHSNTEKGAVTNSYSTGSVNGENNVGGLIGMNEWGIPVSNCFWDTQTSGQATSDGGTGKNTIEMQDISTFASAAWSIRAVNGSGERNLAGIWNIIDGLTYPFLSWQSVS